MPWGAFRFLMEANKKNRQKMRINHLLLMLVRVALILLIGLIGGHAYWQVASNGRSPIHQVIVIDNSASMGQLVDTSDAFSVARVEAHRAIDQLPAGSRVSIFQLVSESSDGTSTHGSPRLVRSTSDMDQAHLAVDSVSLSRKVGHAELAKIAVQQAEQWSQGRLPVYGTLFTDGASNSFQKHTANPTPQTSGSTPPIHVRCVASPGSQTNFWIKRIEIQDRLVGEDEPFFIQASVARSATELAREQLQLTLLQDGQKISEQTLTFQEDATECTLRWRHSLASAGDIPRATQLQFQLPDDALASDNARSKQVWIGKAISTLVVDGSYGSRNQKESSESTSLSNSATVLGGFLSTIGSAQPLLQVTRCGPDDIPKLNLQNHSLIIVSGVVDPESISQPLVRFAESGGSMLVLFTPDCDLEKWNSSPLCSESCLGLQFDLAATQENAESGFHVSNTNQRIEPFLFWPGTSSEEMQAVFRSVNLRFIAPLQAHPQREVRIFANANEGPGTKSELPLFVYRNRKPNGRGSVAAFLSGLTGRSGNTAATPFLFAFDRIARGLIVDYLQSRPGTPSLNESSIAESESNLQSVLAGPTRSEFAVSPESGDELPSFTGGGFTSQPQRIERKVVNFASWYLPIAVLLLIAELTLVFIHERQLSRAQETPTRIGLPSGRAA